MRAPGAVVRRLGRELPLLVVLAGLGAGFGLTQRCYWRKGLLVIGLAVLLAAVLRLLLPERRAGLLAVRSRTRDVVTTGAAGLTIAVLAAFVIPLVPPEMVAGGGCG